MKFSFSDGGKREGPLPRAQADALLREEQAPQRNALHPPKYSHGHRGTARYTSRGRGILLYSPPMCVPPSPCTLVTHEASKC